MFRKWCLTAITISYIEKRQIVTMKTSLRLALSYLAEGASAKIVLAL